MALAINTLDTFSTEFSADSVEWCPIESFQDLLVCGTYQLIKNDETAIMRDSKTSKRLGRIYMFRVMYDGKLIVLQQIDVPAVLDMKWMHIKDKNNRILLAVVNSIGYLQIYQLEDEQNVVLKLIVEQKVSDNNDEEVLALSLDWSTGKFVSDVCISNNIHIIVSDSRGRISRFTLHGNELTRDFSWPVHDFEAWIAAFDYWETHCFYSGGDDCKFRIFDSRIGPESVACSRAHNAGVTSIHSNANKEFALATGSYDEVLRLWDKRSLKHTISEINLGGGIWRLKWDPFSHQYLLAACMYGGFKIIDCESTNTPLIVSEYNEHESICYGCDWSFLKKESILGLNIRKSENSVSALIGTCSFYDHNFKLSAVCSEKEN